MGRDVAGLGDCAGPGLSMAAGDGGLAGGEGGAGEAGDIRDRAELSCTTAVTLIPNLVSTHSVRIRSENLLRLGCLFALAGAL